MNKIFTLIIMVLILSTGCGIEVDEATSEKTKEEETVKIIIETPLYITNGASFKKYDKMIFPVKSFKILESYNGVEITLEEPTEKEVNIFKNPHEHTQEIFKYKDTEKYSKIKYRFKPLVMEQKYGSFFTAEYSAKIELEVYKNEVVEEMQNVELMRSEPHYIITHWLDGYNGGLETYSTKVEGMDEEEKREEIEGLLKYIKSKENEELIKNQTFIDLAKYLEEDINKGRTTKEKAKIIYDWIVKNIEYDNASAEERYKFSNDIETSIQRTLNKKKGTCFDFTFLFNGLAIYFDIPSTIVLGKSNPKFESFHTWNVLYDEASKKTYNVDCTFGAIDPIGNFVPSDNEEFYKDHFIWDKENKKYIPYSIKANNPQN